MNVVKMAIWNIISRECVESHSSQHTSIIAYVSVPVATLALLMDVAYKLIIYDCCTALAVKIRLGHLLHVNIFAFNMYVISTLHLRILALIFFSPDVNNHRKKFMLRQSVNFSKGRD